MSFRKTLVMPIIVINFNLKCMRRMMLAAMGRPNATPCVKNECTILSWHLNKRMLYVHILHLKKKKNVPFWCRVVLKCAICFIPNHFRVYSLSLSFTRQCTQHSPCFKIFLRIFHTSQKYILFNTPDLTLIYVLGPSPAKQNYQTRCLAIKPKIQKKKKEKLHTTHMQI